MLAFTLLSPGGTQGMVEVVAENYHNIWAKKKKLELESKGELGSQHPPQKVSWAGRGRSFLPEMQRAKYFVISPYPDPRWRQSPPFGAV